MILRWVSAGVLMLCRCSIQVWCEKQRPRLFPCNLVE